MKRYTIQNKNRIDDSRVQRIACRTGNSILFLKNISESTEIKSTLCIAPYPICKFKIHLKF